VPSVLTAREWDPPAEMRIALPRPLTCAGLPQRSAQPTLPICPLALWPHAQTVPFAFIPRECPPPAATAGLLFTLLTGPGSTKLLTPLKSNVPVTGGEVFKVVIYFTTPTLSASQ
jgi:hypothetical protein